MKWISTWYIGLYIILIILVILSEITKKKLILNLLVVLLILFSGFRHGVGIDFFVYEHFINSNFSLLFIEPLSRYLIFFARYYEQTSVFFLTTSVIYIATIMYGLKKSNTFNGFTLFVFTLFALSFLTSFGFVRQFVAIGLMFLGLIYLFEGKKIYFLVLAIIAILFHYSAVVFLPFYFFNNLLKKKKKFFYLLISIVISLVSTKLVVFLVDKIGLYAHYIKLSGEDVAGGKIYLSLLLFTLFLMFVEYFFVKKDYSVELLHYSKNMVIIFICTYSAFLPFGEKIVRIAYYFVPFYYIWLYCIFKGIRNKSVKGIYMFFIIIICTFYYFSTLYFSQFSSRGDFLNNFRLNF